MRQWMLRITAYADRLLADLDRLGWPEPIKVAWRNWIGRSRAPTCASSPAGSSRSSRPDTLFGATFMVLAPEHPLVEPLTDPRRSVGRDLSTPGGGAQRAAAPGGGRDKTGVFLGTYATNPVTGSDIPIWVRTTC